MKKMKKLFALMLALVMLFGITSVSTAAASYPSAFLSDTQSTAYVGDTVPIKMTWFPEFKYEGYDLTITNISTGRVVATASNTFYNYSVYSKYFTITWNTSNCAAGTYKVEVVKNFYSFYRWNEAPTRSSWLIDLRAKSKEVGSTGSVTVKNDKKSSVLVTFRKATHAARYQVQYSTTKKFSKKKTIATKKLSYRISGLTKGRTYYIRVRGANGDNYGAWSSVKKVVIKK